MNEHGGRGSAVSRAREDVEAGNPRRARTRLRDYLRARPDDLEVRRLLADLYRQDGHADEAGRWGYLEASAASDEERRLYERAAAHRLRPHWKHTCIRKGLHWASPVEDAPEAVAQVLRRLDALAEQERLDWREQCTPAPVRSARSLVGFLRRG